MIPYTCWMGMIHSSIYVMDGEDDGELIEIEESAAVCRGAGAL